MKAGIIKYRVQLSPCLTIHKHAIIHEEDVA